MKKHKQLPEELSELLMHQTQGQLSGFIWNRINELLARQVQFFVSNGLYEQLEITSEET